LTGERSTFTPSPLGERVGVRGTPYVLHHPRKITQ